MVSPGSFVAVLPSSTAGRHLEQHRLELVYHYSASGIVSFFEPKGSLSYCLACFWSLSPLCLGSWAMQATSCCAHTGILPSNFVVSPKFLQKCCCGIHHNCCLTCELRHLSCSSWISCASYESPLASAVEGGLSIVPEWLHRSRRICPDRYHGDHRSMILKQKNLFGIDPLQNGCVPPAPSCSPLPRWEERGSCPV